jgi:hypothetical protein
MFVKCVHQNCKGVDMLIRSILIHSLKVSCAILLTTAINAPGHADCEPPCAQGEVCCLSSGWADYCAAPSTCPPEKRIPQSQSYSKYYVCERLKIANAY